MIPARCEHCGFSFEVDDQLAGGYHNCPQCGKATAIEGLRDPLWRILQVIGLGAVVVVSALVYTAQGPVAGLTCFVIALAVVWLISRAF